MIKQAYLHALLFLDKLSFLAKFICLATDDEEDSEPAAKPYSQSRYLVGRVPRPAGAKPGRGGGVAIIIKKNVSVSYSTALFYFLDFGH